MKAIDITFGQPLQYNATINPEPPSFLEGKFIELIVMKENLFFKQDDVIFEWNMTEKAKHDLIADLNYYKNACLVRIDSIHQQTVLFTILKFTNVVEFQDNEELKLFIGESITRDFRRLNISKEPVKFFKEQFLVDNVCFARTDEDLEKVTLIGNRYTCTFQRTPQNYMQAVEIKYLKNRANIHGAVFVLKGNISFQDQLNNVQLNKETDRKYTESLKDTHELLKLWNLYSELEAEAAKDQIEEMGSLHYTDTYNTIGENNRLCQVFQVTTKPTNSFLNAGIGYAVADEQSFDKEDIVATKKSLFIGTTAKVVKNKNSSNYELIIELEDEEVIIPSKGYLLGSFAGSKKMAERRDRALKKILNGKTPLVNLKFILQAGVLDNTVVKPKFMKPEGEGTNELLRRIFGSKAIRFTEKQREAIDIAVNTSDIAIIQGPPGTGKTTIIRAIIARLNTLYNGNVSILVSSAQHDAVDNAIENVEYGGLPVNRIGGKKASQQTQSTFAKRNILKWTEDISIACDQIIENEENGYKRQILRDTSLLIHDIDRTKNDSKQVYRHLKKLHLLMQQLDVEMNLIERVERLIFIAGATTEESSDKTSLEENTWLTLLENQRLDKVTFFDDGLQQLALLTRYARASIEQEYDIPEIWIDMRLAQDEEIERLLPAFKQSIQHAINKEKGTNIITVDTHLLEKGIDELIENLQKYIEGYFTQGQSSLSDIIWNFKDELGNPRKIEELINKYTKVNAATCQQSVMNRVSSLNIKQRTEYDYVIIDEAARANPLDLLIPMSLGKKIILVGDHKQLPHLLEQDIVTRLLETKETPEIKKLLEEPLFSRLFHLLDQSKYKTQKRTVMLRDQYRMHPVIADFVSENFYEAALISGVTAQDKFSDLKHYCEKPIAWIDVPQKHGGEYASRGKSRSRKIEVTQVMKEVHKILAENDHYTIGIITFYKKQAFDIQYEVEQLPQNAQSRIEAGTVDSFQGKEFDVVILSTVRSNHIKEKKSRVGFLDSKNRLNVAFSRGKRCLVVVGDAHTVASNDEGIVIQELHHFHMLCKEEGYYEQA